MPKYLKEMLHKDGTKAWKVTYPTGELSDDGKKKYHSRTFKLKRDAKAYLAELDGRNKDGVAIVPTEDTIEAFFKRYFDTIQVRENTLYSYRRQVEAYITPEAKPSGILGTAKLKGLTTKRIQNLYNHMRIEKKLSPRTIRYVHSILHSALDFAVKQKDLPTNPSKGVTLPEKTRQEISPLSLDELTEFLNLAKQDRYHAFLELAAKTGARPGELMGLKWSAVDLEEGAINIRLTLARDAESWYLRPPKTEASVRLVPISAETVAILTDHRKRQSEIRMKNARHWTHHNLVFTDVVGGPLELRVFRRRHFKKVLRATADSLYPKDEAKTDEDVARMRESLLSTRLYDLRHTCATLMIKSGANPKDVSQRLGHKSVAFTLDTYVWPDEDAQREVTDRLESLIKGNVS